MPTYHPQQLYTHTPVCKTLKDTVDITTYIIRLPTCITMSNTCTYQMATLRMGLEDTLNRQAGLLPTASQLVS